MRLLVLKIHNAGVEARVIGKKSKQSILIQTKPKQKNVTKEVIIQNTNQSKI